MYSEMIDIPLLNAVMRLGSAGPPESLITVEVSGHMGRSEELPCSQST